VTTQHETLTSKEVLKKRIQHKEFPDTIKIGEKTKEKKATLNMSRTRAAKVKAQEECTTVDREIEKSIKKDKKDYIVELASQAENDAGQGNLKVLYLTTNRLAGKFQQTNKPVKDSPSH
jgi:hypothetical protein